MTLSVEAVTCHYGRTRVLQDITMALTPGHLTALIGPNGAGKSTLLAAMAGDLRPTTGQIRLGSRRISAWHPTELARKRAVLLQSNDVSLGFTAREIVAMGRHPWARTPDCAQDETVIADALASMEIPHLADKPVRTLSGGERARVGLARVLAQNTELVLLDEPTAALDLRHQEEVMHRALLLARSGRTVAVVLHDLSLAAAYADDIAIICAGRLAGYGPPDEVLTSSMINGVYGLGVDRLETADGRVAFVPHRPFRRKEAS